MGDNTNMKQLDSRQPFDDEATVKVLFNKVYVLNINKEKLQRKSLYFQAALKPSYKDQLLPFVEVNFETSRIILSKLQTSSAREAFSSAKKTFSKFTVSQFIWKFLLCSSSASTTSLSA